MDRLVEQTSLEQRLVRYADLRPCTTAFIDTRTPGSERKENFTIIGPGVAENPDQYVHISEPHGFNIGGARQPPRCLNSQHSHQTAEVFIVHSGRWRFVSGETGKDGHVDLGPGDTISIPIHCFRGFENIGDDVGFMFAVLGGDDPGRVTWAPYVFEAASRHGLVLLKGGRLIDTAREPVPAGAECEPPTSAAEVAALRRLDSTAMAACVHRHDEMRTGSAVNPWPGIHERPIVGEANSEEGIAAGRLAWSHGFCVRSLWLAPGAVSAPHSRNEVEVLLVHSGTPRVETPSGAVDLGPGDTLTVPIGWQRVVSNPAAIEAEVFVVRGGDRPAPARPCGIVR